MLRLLLGSRDGETNILDEVYPAENERQESKELAI